MGLATTLSLLAWCAMKVICDLNCIAKFKSGSSNSPVQLVELRDMLQEIDIHEGIVPWVKVPSHVGTKGNEKANHLAKCGISKHPLFPRSSENPEPKRVRLPSACPARPASK